jgi:hypothetical protein
MLIGGQKKTKTKKTLFHYPIQCRTLLSQSNIRSSDNRLSPISLITEIGLNAHLSVLAPFPAIVLDSRVDEGTLLGVSADFIFHSFL